jgi:hypothetical protein
MFAFILYYLIYLFIYLSIGYYYYFYLLMVYYIGLSLLKLLVLTLYLVCDSYFFSSFLLSTIGISGWTFLFPNHSVWPITISDDLQHHAISLTMVTAMQRTRI